jgi:hypothetical protein
MKRNSSLTKKKIKQNDLTTTKADKGHPLIIIDINHYNQKIDNFIANNKYTKLNKDHTKQQQKTIGTTINTCKTIIKQSDKWKYTNMNPEAPHIHGTIKVHKPDKPARPIVSWRNSPTYKTARQLKYIIPLPNTFNIHNSTELIKELKENNTQANMKLCPFDIRNMYSNIPIQELIQIINTKLQNNDNNHTTKTRNITTNEHHLKPKLHTTQQHLLQTRRQTAHGSPHITNLCRNILTS